MDALILQSAVQILYKKQFSKEDLLFLLYFSCFHCTFSSWPKLRAIFPYQSYSAARLLNDARKSNICPTPIYIPQVPPLYYAHLFSIYIAMYVICICRVSQEAVVGRVFDTSIWLLWCVLNNYTTWMHFTHASPSPSSSSSSPKNSCATNSKLTISRHEMLSLYICVCFVLN